MVTTRRNFIRIIGGGAAILAATSCTRPNPYPDPQKPWRTAGDETEVMRFALAHALLAPNPHNRQPWMVDIHDPYSATLYCDPTKDLPETDPFDRQITIGLGCFLEVFALAVAERGFQAQFEYFPGGSDPQTLDNRAIAKISLVMPRSSQADPLFEQIFDRRTNRNAFAEQKPAKEQLQEIIGNPRNVQASFTNTDSDIAALRDLTMRAAHVEFETSQTYLESVALMRIGSAEIAQNPDGLAINGPGMELLKRVGLVTRKTLADPTSKAFQQGLSQYVKAARTAAAFIWVATPGNSREEQILAGRAYVRQNLMATRLGLAMHPLSQALQEPGVFKEVFEQVHSVTNTTGQRLQMLARVGYAKQVFPAPRYPLSAKLIDHGNTTTS